MVQGHGLAARETPGLRAAESSPGVWITAGNLRDGCNVSIRSTVYFRIGQLKDVGMPDRAGRGFTSAGEGAKMLSRIGCEAGDVLVYHERASAGDTRPWPVQLKPI